LDHSLDARHRARCTSLSNGLPFARPFVMVGAQRGANFGDAASQQAAQKGD
jgi:hypothetical protein